MNKKKMQTKSDLNKIIKQIFGFGIVGFLNNAICLLVYYLVIFLDSDWYLLANALGFIISTLNAYIMNSKFVFKASDFKKKHLLKTYCTYLISFGISTLMLYILVNKINIDVGVAPILSLTVTVPFNFLMNRFWIYDT